MHKLRRLTIIGMDCDYRQVDENGNDITKCWAIAGISEEIQNRSKEGGFGYWKFWLEQEGNLYRIRARFFSDVLFTAIFM